jgi:hypothetical protein
MSRLTQSPDCVTNEMFVNTWRAPISNNVNIEIYCAHEKLCEVQCLKMFQFPLYTLWFKIHVLFDCKGKPETLIITVAEG